MSSGTVPGDDPGGVLDRARAWVLDDPDPRTRDELGSLIDRATGAPHDAPDVVAALAELGDRFAATLQFGTAGLRGALGAGPNRMNRVVVTRAAAGLAAHLRSRGGGSLVVGYDARHGSADFARDTAEVAAGAGLRAVMLPRPLPTPVLAFAVRFLGVDAGVMVTASHNPRRDNGYKVYLADGSQIVSPDDAQIAAEIDAVGPLATVPRADDWERLDEGVLEAYLERVAGQVTPGGPRELRVVYTPLHGVGRDVLVEAFSRAGFAAPSVVSEQGEPDPDFPTVPFPNPEEPGAMDLALALGEQTGADVVLANDPDADRCAVAVPGRMLSGDEVGALIAAHLLRRSPPATGTFATSIVSSSLLGRLAGAAGVGYAETLTGFKWISRVDGLRYGYEEALGYCVDPGGVRDKDGISAALLVAELAASLRAEGRTLLDMLDDLAVEHGLHATSQLSQRVDDPAVIHAAMARLRENPPTSIGGRAVRARDDLAAGSPSLPPTDGLRFVLDDGGRVVVRPSGTEPKVKCYLEVVIAVAGRENLPAARERAAGELSAIGRDLVAAAGLR